jgi:hypothetical protein
VFTFVSLGNLQFDIMFSSLSLTKDIVNASSDGIFSDLKEAFR